MARTFITGASGLIGAALLTRLVERGDDVVALARSDAAADKVRAAGAAVARGDTVDVDALAAGMAGCEVGYHVAGVNTLCPSDPTALLDTNVLGAQAVVRAAAQAGLRRLVLTSSAAAIGEPAGAVGDESTPHRGSYLSVYERSKHEGELVAFQTARAAGVDLVSVNPSSVQGPGRTGGTGRILLAYLNGRLKAFLDTHISLIDIRDCVEGHVLAEQHGKAGERYLLNGVTLTSREALEVISGLTGAADRVRIVPAPVAKGVAALVEGAYRVARRDPPLCREMVRTLLHGHRYDGSRATRELGLQYTPVQDTFARTVEWALANGLVKRSLPGWESRRAAAGTTTTMDDDPLKHSHPAQPMQPDSGFAEGQEDKPDTPVEEQEPDFARGERTGPEIEAEERHRFSEGQEETPPTPDKEAERRFSEGQEH